MHEKLRSSIRVTLDRQHLALWSQDHISELNGERAKDRSWSIAAIFWRKRTKVWCDFTASDVKLLHARQECIIFKISQTQIHLRNWKIPNFPLNLRETILRRWRQKSYVSRACWCGLNIDYGNLGFLLQNFLCIATTVLHCTARLTHQWRWYSSSKKTKAVTVSAARSSLRVKTWQVLAGWKTIAMVTAAGIRSRL